MLAETSPTLVSVIPSSWTQGAAEVPSRIVLSSLAAVRERSQGIPRGTLAGMAWWSVGKVAGASWYQLVPSWYPAGTSCQLVQLVASWYQLVPSWYVRYELVPVATSWVLVGYQTQRALRFDHNHGHEGAPESSAHPVRAEFFERAMMQTHTKGSGSPNF